MITEDYVNKEIAKLLKKKGFDWECKTMKYFPEPDYDQESPDGVYAPTLQMVLKWLREVHNIDITITPDYKENYTAMIFVNKELPFTEVGSFKTYEEACEAAIKHCLTKIL